MTLGSYQETVLKNTLKHFEIWTFTHTHYTCQLLNHNDVNYAKEVKLIVFSSHQVKTNLKLKYKIHASHSNK